MILDRIELENFGLYGGRQEAILTPLEGKPIILVGGLNGVGKTTFLDAVQLALYGKRAMTSQRGKLSYRDLLLSKVHRNGVSGEDTSITLTFRCSNAGTINSYTVQRAWKTVEPSGDRVVVSENGLDAPHLAQHWDDFIESLLPSRVAPLFFFDGEQVEELADGQSSSEILRTAMNCLLGLEKFDLLSSNLKLYERRVKAESTGAQQGNEAQQLISELQGIDTEQGRLILEEGQLRNELGRVSKQLSQSEEEFRTLGGEFYLRRAEIEQEHQAASAAKSSAERRLRDELASSLPLTMVHGALRRVVKTMIHEEEVRTAKLLVHTLSERDERVLNLLRKFGVQAKVLQQVGQSLNADRSEMNLTADEEPIFGASEDVLAKLQKLVEKSIPESVLRAQEARQDLEKADRRLVSAAKELLRIPDESAVADKLQSVIEKKTELALKSSELEALLARKESLRRQQEQTEARFEKIAEGEVEHQTRQDDRNRILRHSERVRDTIGRLKETLVVNHTSEIARFMLESANVLLRKGALVENLQIDPRTFEPLLFRGSHASVSFDELSAGERQLLAIAMLWGLARASRRPVPTIIDTPLGRLDSTHRRRLVESYFPRASHQVILLSTDEELNDREVEALMPYISRSYLLDHNERTGSTVIKEGYFTHA